MHLNLYIQCIYVTQALNSFSISKELVIIYILKIINTKWLIYSLIIIRIQTCLILSVATLAECTIFIDI